MSRGRTLMTFFLVTIVSAVIVDAIRCYDCYHCGEPFRKKDSKVAVCESPYDVCVKVFRDKTATEGGSNIHRGCAERRTQAAGCTKQNDNQGSFTSCICDRDECNGAESSTRGLTSTLLFTMMCFITIKLIMA
ncbi:hypothetical protein RvY_17909 [Ramazzottius varieornatus]|uniref:Protein sleepless n=1 Tax=Ramazzottius varieornatus TaxID=947166 RepID=A0A1D1W7G6_RAMVA|nr:hypothetical protein RvY_17909 [Ramazzottius varieornatus]